MDKNSNTKNEIKMLLSLRDISLCKLVRKLNQIHNTNHQHSNLSKKLIKNTIRFSEVKEIADLLGYEITFKEKPDWEEWEEK